jgi:hypothetical protein
LLALFERSQHSKLAFHVPHTPWYSAYNNASAYHVLPLHTMKQLLVWGLLRYLNSREVYLPLIWHFEYTDPSTHHVQYHTLHVPQWVADIQKLQDT